MIQPENSGRALKAETPSIIGHRGAAARAPENTLASIRRAYDDGARWVEFDVKLTLDGIPIVMHDDHLDRTTDLTGAVAQTTFETLSHVSAGAWFDRSFAGEKIPTLRETLATLLQLGLGANIEIKPCPGRERETAAAAISVLAETWPTDVPWPLISSFSEEALDEVKRFQPVLPCGLLMTSLSPDWKEKLERLDCATVHLDHASLDDNALASLVRERWPLVLYTVNDVDRARHLLERGAHALITDDPRKLIDRLGVQ